MKRIVLGCWLLLATSVSAAQTFACQYLDSAGLDWKRGSWEVTRFKLREPFFLTLKKDAQELTFESTANLLGGVHTCITDVAKVVTCMGVERGYQSVGSFLLFDPNNMKGGMSFLTGSTANEERFKDSLIVTPFKCQKVK